MKMSNMGQMPMQDHDLLIEVNTKLDRVILDVKELNNNTNQRVTDLEHHKADRTEIEDHEVRLRRLERYGAMAIGGMTLLQIGLQLYFK
jgi:hypothetical protein